MKVILCGYNWTGCKALNVLMEAGYEIFVYTHENPPHINSVVEYCKKNKVPYSTQKINVDNLPFVPDLISSVYYRFIIKQDIIDICKGKIFNLHPSLLPQYRGCSSLTWAMINGEKEVGFTYHYINDGVDTGNIILQSKVMIEDFDTQQTLYNRVMFKSMEFYSEALHKVMENFIGTPQNSMEGTYYKRGCPYNGQIDPSWDEKKIDRFIRAMNYPPLPYATYKGVEIKSINEYLSIS